MNPLPTNGQMSFRDAAIVAFILALSTVTIVYVPSHSYDVIIADVYRAAFDLAVLIFATWVGNFVVLTGLNVYAKRAQETAT